MDYEQPLITGEQSITDFSDTVPEKSVSEGPAFIETEDGGCVGSEVIAPSFHCILQLYTSKDTVIPDCDILRESGVLFRMFYTFQPGLTLDALPETVLVQLCAYVVDDGDYDALDAFRKVNRLLVIFSGFCLIAGSKAGSSALECFLYLLMSKLSCRHAVRRRLQSIHTSKRPPICPNSSHTSKIV